MSDNIKAELTRNEVALLMHAINDALNMQAVNQSLDTGVLA